MPKKINCHSERGRRPTRNLHSLAIFFVAFLSLVGLVFLSPSTLAQEVGDSCFCKMPNGNPGACNVVYTEGVCTSAMQRECTFFNSLDECWSSVRAFLAIPAASAQADEEEAPEPTLPPLPSANTQSAGIQKGRAAFLPPCILEDRLDKDSECRDISIFVILGINIANYLFTIIGALALLMFIYGGVLFVISQGNPEKVKKGADAMLAAVIGLIVVFSAYLLVGFLGEVVGVENRFKL